MNSKSFRAVTQGLALLFVFHTLAAAQELKPIPLPKPQTGGGKPLMQALKERQSARAFSTNNLPPQVLANMLWAAWGVNRPDSGLRTAPSASNRQELDVYVATSNGLFLYDAKAHALQPILTNDVRGATGMQPFVKEAPVNLIYVADFARAGSGTDEDKLLCAADCTGSISQNVYLFCASEGLTTVVRGMVPKAELAKIMKLRPEQKIILAQTVGYPAK
jgi:nitroreductase